ncbi:NAD(P)/FAD-dependent oxidoreductase [Dyadobacter psychrotolerans]|uniref:NADH:ubiquinone reductase (non-electrogenic) n=1 Tax=Dyadobacter psychrotolerans TaxID=2541721 RepID=A0A4R5DW26_9BACT|nr:NAD(P)/FAD-dependent oxidoreductase [Dyadobacter psychrotolerans]TDE15455.1 NAD(P)/FAD-dependent oxidoreductase [Dyadobacter psychrotolerans]
MHIVIIGGGFAGVNLALALGDNKDFEITLVDKNNYNFFPPLIYQVATGFLEPSSISYPFRKLFSSKENVHFRLGYLQKVIPEANKIILHNGEVEYDYLVFATGAKTNFFGMENVKQNAIAMKTLDDAIEMRNKLLQQMEQATISTDPEDIKKRLTIVIAGGGPTGVELSGMFAEMRNGIMRKEYPELVGKGSEIYLIDGGDALLSPMSAKSQQETYKELKKLGVNIMLKSRVKDFVNDTVYLASGQTIPAKTLIWAAGVTAKVFEGLPAESYGRGGRMVTDEFNKVHSTANVYAIGDTALQLTDTDWEFGHPQVAQVAIQQGRHLARNFKLMVANKPLQPFKYKDKGSMAIIGRMEAVADLPKPKVHFNGVIAWFAWLFIHLISLITYRNRARTLYNWMIAYFTKDQSLRMIIKPTLRSYKED